MAKVDESFWDRLEHPGPSQFGGLNPSQETMDNVIVEEFTGLIGVSSMIKAAMPGLHAGSVLRSARTAMRNSDGPGLTTKMVGGRMTTMASLNVCNYILDNLSGQRWVEWRTSQGDSFKESLAQRVTQVPLTEVTIGKSDITEAQEIQETKASTLKKAFRTLNIDGFVRIDEASGKASIIDVILLLSPGVSRDSARKMLSCLLEKEDAIDTDEAGNNFRLADLVSHIKINGVGHITPACDASTIVQIIWLLPASAAKSFKRESAQVICQVMGGDVSLCAEIEERCTRLQSTPQGQAFQNFVLGGNTTAKESQAKRIRIGPPIMELASEEEYAKYVQVGLKKEMVNSEVSLVMSLKEAFEQIRPLEPRDRIELCDRISDIQRRTFRSLEESSRPVAAITSSSSANSSALAAPASTQRDPGHDIPTPQCSRGVRGNEISIPMIANEMKVSIRGRGGLVGKKLKALYAERYGQNAANNIPKRATVYLGRPYQENMYFARDKDLVERAIRVVAG